MSAEDLATVREYLARGSGIDGPPNDPVAELVRRILTELDATRDERDLAAAELHRLCDAAEAHRCVSFEHVPDRLTACEEPGGEVGVTYPATVCACTLARRCDLCVERAQSGAP